MTVVVTTTHAADADIEETIAHIEAQSQISARRFRQELLQCFARIAEQPHAAFYLSKFGLRRTRVSARFQRYLVFYREIDAETLEVVRVLDGTRDLPTLLPDRR